MKQPYFVERELPHLVRKYMETHTMVDIDVLTQHLIDEHHKFRHKKFKPFRKSVTEAYKWNYYLMEKEEQKAAQSLKIDTSYDDVKLEDLDGQPATTNDNNGNVDDEIVGSIMMKNRKGEQQFFPMEAPKLVDLQGVSSLVEPISQILWRMKECPLQRTYCLRLTGPDSCGKTTLIRAMADNMSLPLYFIKVKAVLSGGPLSSPLKKMQEELKKAREILPGVIVFHHLDLLYSREVSSSSKNEQETVASAVFEFITEMVASSGGVKVLVVAETSRPEVLDWDLNKRFTERIHIALPSVADKESILRHLCGSDVAAGTDLASVALKASGFVAGDLVSLVEHAKKLALDRSWKASVYGQAKSVKDFDPNLKSCHNGDPPKLEVTIEDLINAIKLVTPSLKRKGFPVIPDTTWADIGGLDLAKKELRDSILKPIKDPESSSNFCLVENSGVLLWGPPGCGKTLLAKAVANEAGVNLLTVSGPELLSMYQGESERAVREVFARAESVAPCVIFFDEFDSLCPRRSKTGSESGSKSTIVNMLLTETDGFLSRPGIYLIAATNLPSLLDPAVLRPGRFETKLYVGLPSAEGRVAVLKATTKNGTKPRLASDVDLEAIARRKECENFTGADCKNLVTRAKKIAREEHELKVREQEAVAASDTSASHHFDAEPGTKKRKRSDNVDAHSPPAKVADRGAADAAPAQPALDCYPEGEFLLYARHFNAAFKQIKPSVLEKDLRMYELQLREFMAE